MFGILSTPHTNPAEYGWELICHKHYGILINEPLLGAHNTMRRRGESNPTGGSPFVGFIRPLAVQGFTSPYPDPNQDLRLFIEIHEQRVIDGKPLAMHA